MLGKQKMGNIGAKNMLQTLDIPKIVIVGNVLSTLRTVAEWWNPSSTTSHLIMWTMRHFMEHPFIELWRPPLNKYS